jgi:hypothetical protein
MYNETANWSYLFFPPPYNFLAPPASLPAPGVVAPEEVLQAFGNGLGCSDCGGTCGGLGQASTGLFGTGLFASSDPSTWGVGEYLTIAIGGYLVINVVSDAQSVGKTAKRTYRRIRS